MAPYIITPWRSHQDLLHVRQQLYRLEPEAQDERSRAVGRVMAWRLRGHLPHAVESTALLVDAFLHHDIAGNSSFSIRAVYSAAFCRFVTGFCDIGRNRERSLEPSSMLDIARQIDMPEGFVALRHEATHEELPSEQRLTTACEGALQWLWKVYWSRLDATTERIRQRGTDENRSEECVAFAQKMFKEYRTTKRDILKRKKSSQDDQLHAHTVDAVENLKSLCSTDTDALRKVTDDIVAKDWLIPSDRSLGSSLQGAHLLWDDLLLATSDALFGFVPSLVSSCLHVLSDGVCADTRKEAYVLWLMHLLSAEEWNSHTLSSLPGQILKFCMLHPNDWTLRLGQDVLNVAEQDVKEEWSELWIASSAQQETSADLTDATSNVEHRQLAESCMAWHLAILPPSTPIGVVSG